MKNSLLIGAEEIAPSQNSAVSAIIRQGGSIIFPTETIYGLGSIATDAAVAKLFEIKGRSPQKPPPIIVSDYSQLSRLVAEIPTSAQKLMDKYWPGALTIIFPAQNDLPEIICGKSTFMGREIPTIAVRMTSGTVARALCKIVDAPLVATSANFSGATGNAAAPRTLADIPTDFQRKTDVIIDGESGGEIASTIVDCTVAPPRVLRAGAIKIDAAELI